MGNSSQFFNERLKCLVFRQKFWSGQLDKLSDYFQEPSESPESREKSGYIGS